MLPSVSTIFADLYASPLHPFPLTRLYLVGIGKFRREKLWFVAIIRIIFSSLIFYLPSVLPSCLKDKKSIYICFSSSISSYSFVLRWNLSERNYSFVRANDQDPFLLNFSPSSPAKSEKTKIVAIIRGCLDQ